MRIRSRRLAQHLLLGATVGVLATIGVAPPAQANPPAKASPDQHCIVVVEPVKKGETKSRVISEVCAATQAAATTQATRAAPSRAPVTTIIRFYEHEFFLGRTKTISAYGGGCAGGRFYAFADVRPSGWGTNSWKSYGACNHVTLYENINWGGDSAEYQATKSWPYVPGSLSNHVWSAEVTEW